LGAEMPRIGMIESGPFEWFCESETCIPG